MSAHLWKWCQVLGSGVGSSASLALLWGVPLLKLVLKPCITHSMMTSWIEIKMIRVCWWDYPENLKYSLNDMFWWRYIQGYIIFELVASSDIQIYKRKHSEVYFFHHKSNLNWGEPFPAEVIVRSVKCYSDCLFLFIIHFTALLNNRCIHRTTKSHHTKQ